MPTPSLILVPARFKTGKLYTPLATTSGGTVLGASGDFNVTRATAATRVNSAGLIESVASGIPRLDYFASGGTVGCPALLVEPAATNLSRWVNQMTAQDTPAASGGMTVTTGSTDFLAPDGTSGSITKYVGGAASGTSQYAYYTGGGIVATASGAHTYSLFVKRGATNPLNFCTLGIENYAGGSGTIYSYFNLASGTALTAGASVQNYGNGWYRLTTAPYTLAAGDLNGTLSFFMAEGNGDLSWPASGALNLTAYTWGAQFEAGSIATSYIPTTTGSVTRNADVVSVTGAVSGSIGQASGTIYAEVDIRNLTDGRIFTLFNSSTRYILLSKATNRLGGAVIDTSSSPTTLVNLQTASGSLTAGTYKLALAYASGDFAFYVNGTQVATSSTGGVIGGYTIVRLGNFDTSLFFNDRIRAVALYPNRLTNDQLAALTTP